MAKLEFEAASEEDKLDYIYQRAFPDKVEADVWYKATVLKCAMKDSKGGEGKKQRPMLVLSLGVDGAPEGGVRVDTRVMEPLQGSPSRTRLFKALGYDHLNNGAKGGFDTDEFVGLQFLVKPERRLNTDPTTKVQRWQNDIRDMKSIVDDVTPTRLYTPKAKDEIDEVPFSTDNIP